MEAQPEMGLGGTAGDPVVGTVEEPVGGDGRGAGRRGRPAGGDGRQAAAEEPVGGDGRHALAAAEERPLERNRRR
jgi:hypothetical protein